MPTTQPSSRRLLRSLSLALLALPVFAATTQAADQTSATNSQILQATTVPVYFDLEATLEAVHESTISAQTSGAIKAVHYDVNDRVEQGALLLEIVDTQQQAQLEQARANLAQAKAQNEDAQVLLTRNSRLFKQGTLSQGEFDSSNARAKSAAAAVKAAAAALKQAEEQLAYTQVKAPYAGLVKTRYVEVGELVSPGQPLMTGVSLEQLRAVADAPQRIASQYQEASQIQVRVGEHSINPDSVVLFPYADATHHSVRLRANLPANSLDASGRALYPGQWSIIRVQTGERNALLIPASALLQRSELTSVYVLDNGQPELRQVRAGNRHNGMVEILSGLSAGDEIVSDALAQLAAIGSQGE
ncbi:efflux RND transporter periplasmic adaptor subunit [Thalassolituus sp. UBA2009]|jgi:RND family efflux transporter MFP subunit|uniref:efflux RND transporter periplasmic adaptor subunit n=1 Tax=Thalassolituus sp. UBA2009 TaxID=1947658 RepID=UPI00257C077F|nr:efflux RND transporter periplasmic adaptor subunit [Thalassolituus sp. UBA2009]